MALVSTIKDLIGSLVTQNFTELPETIHSGLINYLNEEEHIIITLLNHRAIYKAPKFIDSNTFFHSWFILTSDRIIIVRNSSGFKRFRDIRLADITQMYYELDETEPKIYITTPGNEDIIEFMRAGAEHCKNLDKLIDDAIESAKNRKTVHINDKHILCNKCGSQVLSQSKYCSECGSRMDAVI